MILNKILYTMLGILTMHYGVCLMVAAPPQPPKIFACIFYYKSSSLLTCTWIAERNIGTVYTLSKQMLKRSEEEESCSSKSASTSEYDEIERCSTPRASCSLLYQPISDREYRVWVTAENILGKATSEPICLISRTILKPDPPQITKIEPVPGMKQMLKVQWTKPEYMPPSAENNTRCQIRYKSIMGKDIKEAFMEEESATFALTDLWDCTDYTVDIRCAHGDSKYWSEWSAKKMATTEGKEKC